MWFMWFSTLPSRCWSVFFQAEDGIRDGHVTGVQTCALPICPSSSGKRRSCRRWSPTRTHPPAEATVPSKISATSGATRSEEHTSELQSRGHLVCRLLLEKKNFSKMTHMNNFSYVIFYHTCII